MRDSSCELGNDIVTLSGEWRAIDDCGRRRKALRQKGVMVTAVTGMDVRQRTTTSYELHGRHHDDEAC